MLAHHTDGHSRFLGVVEGVCCNIILGFGL